MLLIAVWNMLLLFLAVAAGGSDQDTLFKFYTELGRESQAVLAARGWNFSQNALGSYIHNSCSWSPAVFCDDGGNINNIDLTSHRISGTLPSCLADLTGLEGLLLSKNNFYGSIPPQWTRLKLKYLGLSSNSLSSTLPSSMEYLTTLEMLDVSSNSFSGNLDRVLNRKLVNMQTAIFRNNQFSGELLLPLASLAGSEISFLDLSSNDFHGKLSSDIGNMTMLLFLNISYNRLTGALPSSLSQLTDLIFLDVRRNSFSGSAALPGSIQILRLSGNAITFFDLQAIPYAQQILAANNSIYQPLVIGAMPNLQVLDVSNNKFYGPLHASALNSLASLEVLSCEGNAFTGGIPVLDRLLSLRLLNVANNALAFSIPTFLGALTALEVLDLSANLLTGTVPPGLFPQRSPLLSVSLSSNFLTGSVPSTLANLASLLALTIDHNKFTSLPDLSALISIKTIDISFNLIRGYLPATLFASHPNLESVVASSNSFVGELPAEEICSARRLSVLVLDGLGLGLPEHAGAISGGIHPCILSLPNLTTLHLAGNGIDGSLVLQKNPAQSLQDLSLGHNRLTGPIPQRLLAAAGQFRTLDLSFNRFRGDLGAMATPQFYSTVLLLVNRLSGSIPERILRTLPPPPTGQSGSRDRVFSILEGSMFDCNALEDTVRTLPQEDPFVKRFQCGSDSFDKYLISLATVVCCIPLIVRCCAAWAPSRFAFTFPTFDFSPAQPPLLPRDVAAVFNVLLRLRLLAAGFGTCFIVLLIPIYAGTSAVFSTQEYAYAYTVSAGFKSGLTPSAVFLVLWTFVILGGNFLISVFAGVDQRVNIKETTPESVEKTGSDSGFSLILLARLATVFAIDSTCVAAGNYGFLSVIASADVSGQVMAKLAFALFKFLTNNYGMPALMWLMLSNSREENTLKKYIHIKAFLLILNSVIIPCVVTAMQSNSCFLPILVSPPPIVVNYPRTSCTLDYMIQLSENYTVAGLESSLSCKTLVLEAGLRPPFRYNHQCTSFLIQTYAPVFVLVALISVLEFAIHNLLAALLERLVAVQPTLGPWRFIAPFVPKLLLSHTLRHRIRRAHVATAEKNDKEDAHEHSESDQFGLLDDKVLFYRSLSDVLVVVSFGVVVPLLAAATSTGLYVRALRKHNMLARYLQLCSGRVLSLERLAGLEGAGLEAAKATLLRLAETNSAGNEEIAVAVDAVMQARHSSFDALSAALLAAYDTAACPACPETQRQKALILEALDLQREWDCFLSDCAVMAGAKESTSTPLDEVRVILLIFSCLFLCLFLVDIGGDAVGVAAALWAPVLLCIVPPLFYLLACHALPAALSRGAVRWVQERLLPPLPPSDSLPPPPALHHAGTRVSIPLRNSDSRLSVLDIIPAEGGPSHAEFLGRLRSHSTNPLHTHPMRRSQDSVAPHDSL